MDRLDRLRVLTGGSDDWRSLQKIDASASASINSVDKQCLAHGDIAEVGQSPQPSLSPNSIIKADRRCNNSNDNIEDRLNMVLSEAGNTHGARQSNIEVQNYGLEFAEEISFEETFCHLNSLIKFPYDHIPIGLRRKGEVAEKFFEKGKVLESSWDLFYIYPPTDCGPKPIILLPTSQVQAFLEEINRKQDICLSLPDTGIYPSFGTRFPTDDTPRPRFLGHSTEREMAEGLKLAVPSNSWKPRSELEVRAVPLDSSVQAFRARIAHLLEVDVKKKVAAKIKKNAERRGKQQSWAGQIKRVQRYLGIREAHHGHNDAVKKAMNDSKLSELTSIDHKLIPFSSHITAWAAYEEATKETSAKLREGKEFDITKPGHFSRENSVVFICVDIEAYERDHKKITEIGFATLDTNDLGNVPPGENGTGWMQLIRARHYRIKEYKHLVNKDFVEGCPDKFQFGESEFISLKDALTTIASCFKPPYSGPFSATAEYEPKRNIILVGHGLSSDINFMKDMGYNVHNLSNLQENIDTTFMYRSLRRETNPKNLGACLASLGIAGWWLHNAGNDAVYTMQAMISIAVHDMLEKQLGDEVLSEKWDEIKTKRVEQSVKEAAENAKADLEGWSSGPDDDGGAPQASNDEGLSTLTNRMDNLNVYGDGSGRGRSRGGGRGRGAGGQRGQRGQRWQNR